MEELAAPPDAEACATSCQSSHIPGEPERAVIEIDDRRAVHPRHARAAWVGGAVADGQRVKGLARVACETDRVDARVLAVLSHRNLVQSMLKHRIHSTLLTFGHPCPASDLFGLEGRKLLDRLEIPEP